MQPKIKPLVWDHHPLGYIAAPTTGRAYIIDIRVKNRVFFIKGMEPPPNVSTLSEAKTLAEADYVSRVTAAIDPEWLAAVDALVMEAKAASAVLTNIGMAPAFGKSPLDAALAYFTKDAAP